MSVYTKVAPEQLSAWLKQYSIGNLVELQGIAAGIENTNYFVTTTQGRYVLTMFERMRSDELPFYLNLMAHLARGGIPCPAPVANRDNAFLGVLNGKPATIVTRLSGAPVLDPEERHCSQVGSILAAMHLAVTGYDGALENPRGLRWQRQVAPDVLPFLDARRQELLASELEFQSQQRFEILPRGPVHGDLFRDNVLFERAGAAQRIGGIIDFYFAGVDSPATSSRAARARCWSLTRARARSRPRSGTPGRRCCGRRRCASGCRGCTTSTCRVPAS